MGEAKCCSGLQPSFASLPVYLDMTPFRGWDVEEERLCIGGSEPSWTSSRCQRLLRPLTSKIALLRKMKVGDSSESCRSPHDASVDPSPGSSKSSQHSSKVQDFDPCAEVVNRTDEMDWTAFSRPRKRLRRTYSGKSRLEVSTSSTDPGPKPTTKTSAEAILQLFSEDSEVQAVVRDNNKQLALNTLQIKESATSRGSGYSSVDLPAQRRVFTDLAKSSCRNHWKILAGLHDSLVALLKATAEDQSAMVRSIDTTHLDCLGPISCPTGGNTPLDLSFDMSKPRKNSPSSVLCLSLIHI